MSINQSNSQFERFKKTQQVRFNKFIEKAKKIHGNIFNYDKVIYKNSHTNIIIDCPTHGEFNKLPYMHLQGQGCPKCSHNYPLTHEQYIAKSKEKYNDKYEIISVFAGIKHPIIIKCKEHSVFTTIAERHLLNNGGCPQCAMLIKLENLKPGNISKKEKKWLDDHNVPIRQYKITIDEKNYLVDGYDPATNTVYEYYGSYWHGNPEKYPPERYNNQLGKTFGEIYQLTILREQILSKSYNIITYWD